MKTFKRALGAALVFAAALLAACDNSYGIFDQVQKEREQKGQDIFKKKAVSAIVELGGSYYAATSSVYARPAAAGSEWTRIDVGGHSDYRVYGLAATSARVYVSTDRGVFALDGTTLTAAPAGNETLFAANDQLFVVSHVEDTSTSPSTSTYSLFHLAGTAFEAVQNFAPATNKSIRGVAYENGNYYFAAEDTLVTSGSADGAGGAPVAALAGKTIWSASSAGGAAYIGTTDGNLYRFDVGMEPAKPVASIPLSVVAAVPMSSTTWKLVVGTQTISSSTDPLGYFESIQDTGTALASTTFAGGESGLVARNSSVYSTTIKNLPVNALLYSGNGSGGTLFAGISSYTSTGVHYGLYSSDWTGSSWTGWKAE